MNFASSISVVGTGMLANRIFQEAHASGRWDVDRPPPNARTGGTRLVIAACDVPDLDLLLAINRCTHAEGVAFLPVWAEFGEIRIGPLVPANSTGCLSCAETRRINNEPKGVYHRAALAQASAQDSEPLPELALKIAVATVQSWIECWDADPASQAGAIWLLKMRSLEASRHPFLPDPRCKVCDRRPDDSAESAARPAPSRPTPAGWRLRPFDNLDQLKAHFVDARTGIITTVGTDITTNICAPGPARHRIADYHQEDWTAGLTHRFPKSQSVGIIEAIERYAGLRPRAKRTVVRAAYRDVRECALDPRTLILYSEAQYAQPSFPCRAFSSETEMSWVWGYSLGQDRPILVPEQVAYYDVGIQAPAERFIIENSNGCAAGGSVEEALFFGLLEVLERDATMRTWYGRRSVRRFDLNSVRDPQLRMALDRITDITDYDLHAFDLTQEFGVPTVWLMAVNNRTTGPKSFSASKAHPDPEVAVSGALGELAGAIHYHEAQYEKRRSELLPMLQDSSLVREEFDHTLLSGLPEAFGRFDFLFENREPPRDLASARPERLDQWRGDAGVAALGLSRAIVNQGYDVIFVDQTPPESEPFGLHVGKAIVPGLLPFTIGHYLRRIELSTRAGRRLRAEIWPHPFP